MRAAGERVCWGLTAVVVAAWLALVEVFWLPLRVGGVLVPLSIVVAVAANLLLPAAALRLSGSRLVAVLPAVPWLVVAVAAMIRRPEGDLVMSGGGALGVVNLAFLMLGVLAAAFSVGRALGGPLRPWVGPDAVPAPDRAGSGSGGAR
jgi:hypothetical protein